jgi:hypothetical protein
VTEVNLAAGAQREVEIQQGWLRRETDLGGAFEDLLLPVFKSQAFKQKFLFPFRFDGVFSPP